MRSYYQERVVIWERIFNLEYVLNHLEIIKTFFLIDHLTHTLNPPPPFREEWES